MKQHKPEERTVSWPELVELIRHSEPMSEKDRNDSEWWESMKAKGLRNGS